MPNFSQTKLATLRRKNPITLFGEWLADAERVERINHNAAVLATIGAGEMPQARTILLKEYGRGGLVFFTNRESRKGLALRARARAALVFYWRQLGRQVVVEGDVREISRARTAAYFRTRPRTSQIGAWISRQSQPIGDYDELATAAALFGKNFSDKSPSPPPHWGGFCLRPRRMEFWLEGRGRLHQRLLFEHSRRGWYNTLLQP